MTKRRVTMVVAGETQCEVGRRSGAWDLTRGWAGGVANRALQLVLARWLWRQTSPQHFILNVNNVELWLWC
jgi:hypothetical protein